MGKTAGLRQAEQRTRGSPPAGRDARRARPGAWWGRPAGAWTAGTGRVRSCWGRRKYPEEVGGLGVTLTGEELVRIDGLAPKGAAAGQRSADMSTVNR
jgi:hypothetical protein